MSLFHLFSKPKVERARGYGDRGPATSIARPLNRTEPSKKEAASLAPLNDAASTRATSLFSFRGQRNQTNSQRVQAPEFKPAPRERRQIHFDPPPLFQAFPQSIKDGVLFVSTSPLTEPPSSKTAKRMPSAPNLQAANRLAAGVADEKRGAEARAQAALLTKEPPNAASAQLSKKMFVLVTSGYLLQYGISGPSDRLPEKMLSLGAESAAFASDLVPGKPYALQVSGVVDGRGVTVPQSSSLFSKLGLRGTSARRMTPQFILVMEDAKEMQVWMVAIRRQIELAGGKPFSVDNSAQGLAGKEGGNGGELRKTPSHRYLVKRDPSKISNVSSPVTTPGQEITAFTLPVPTSEDGKSEPPRPQSSLSEAATIDGIEAAASKLADEKTSSNEPLGTAGSTTTDRPPYTKLRLNTDLSRTGSRVSTTRNSTTVTSPFSALSFLDSPTSDQESNSGYGPVRNNSIQSQALGLSPTEDRPVPQLLEFPAAFSKFDVPLESPVIGRHPTPPQAPLPRRSSRASSEQRPSLPNVATTLPARDKRDSKMPPPPPVTSDVDRPESFLGDLPPPSTWSVPKPVPSRRHSGIQTTPPSTLPNPVLESQTSMRPMRSSVILPQGILKQPPPPKPAQGADATRASIKARRISGFSIPLKVNPSTAWNQNAPGLNNRRVSQLSDSQPTSEPPQVHTLTAKVEPQVVKRFSLSPTPTASPVSDQFPNIPGRASSNRLSLFPHHNRQPSSSVNNSPDSTSSKAMPPSPPPSVGTAQVLPLKRPTSLQVRTDHAPFLSNSRGSIAGASSLSGAGRGGIGSGCSRPALRGGLRASRSASNMPSLASANAFAHPQASPPEAFRGLDFGTSPTSPSLSETFEEYPSSYSASAFDAYADADFDADTDHVTPLPSSSQLYSNPPSRRSSRQYSANGAKPLHDHATSLATSRSSIFGGGGVKPRSSAPELDLGIMGLGPPAPPPSAPLPPPPPAAAAAATKPRNLPGLGIDAPTPAASASANDERRGGAGNSKDTRVPVLAGLGIQVS